MVIYVGGGSGSGKSAFAERLIANSGIDRRTYIATMQVWDDEGRERVERHRQLRAGKGFQTIECPAVPEKPEAIGGAVLLEDLTNLFTNEWFSLGKAGASLRVRRFLETLAGSADRLVIVGNDIFSDGCDYGADMHAFLTALGELNRFAAGLSDSVYEVVCGLPILHGGSLFKGGGGMTLIIGGTSQGKLEYAKGLFEEATTADNPEDAVKSNIFLGLETWLRQAELPYKALEALLIKNPGVVILCDEVGCGVVPLREEERAWRERVGRVCSWLAERAGSVVRLYCGIPTVLKGETL